MDQKELPLFEVPFQRRVWQCWEVFLQGEEELRRLIDQKAESDVIMDKLNELLSPAFDAVYAEVGFNGEKHDLILNLEGDWSRLFSLVYFKRHAPKQVLEHWNILVGRQSNEKAVENFQIDIWGNSVCAEDIRVWSTWADGKAALSVYCENLVPLLEDKAEQAYGITYILLDQAVGELAEMKYTANLEILHAPKAEPALKLGELLQDFMTHLSLTREELLDAERYIELYSAYHMQPDEEATDGLRGDVIAGSTCFIPLLNEFWSAESYIMDTFEADGIAAGYLFYPLDLFDGEDRGAKILDFRDRVVAQLEDVAGADAFSFIGGANGIYFGYIDFIAWDLKAVLDAAVSIFERSGIAWAAFHSFRQDVGGVTLYER